MFLIYIDHVAHSVKHSNILMFADDIALYKSIHSSHDYDLLQDDVFHLSTWLTQNHLTLNYDKTAYMLFTRKHHPTLPPDGLLQVHNHQIVRVTSFKYLGLNLTPDLSWKLHIQIIYKKACKLIGLIFRNFAKNYDFNIIPF